MENEEIWEKVEEARRRECDEIEIEDKDGKSMRIHIDKIGWYTEYY